MESTTKKGGSTIILVTLLKSFGSRSTSTFGSSLKPSSSEDVVVYVSAAFSQLSGGSFATIYF